MSIIAALFVVGVVAVGVAVYQLVKNRKAVTVASVEAALKADIETMKSSGKKL